MGGCCSSEEDNAAAARPMVIAPPHHIILQVPRRRVDENGVPLPIEDHELDAATITRALHLAARYLASRRANLCVIAVVAATNVLLLQSRQSTHDIDFLGTNMNNSNE